MTELSTVAIAFRLLVAGVVMLGPTVLFLGLWRFLTWLRDDALVDRLAARGLETEPQPAAVDFLSTLGAGDAASDRLRNEVKRDDDRRS